MTISDKLNLIRNYLKNNDLEAYIIPSADPHLSEYVPDYWKIREWISGFTGSAGTVVITNDFAGLWTDSRYFLQAEKELQNSTIQLVKLKIPHTPEYIQWLAETLSTNAKIGFDSQLFSVGLVRRLESAFSKKNLQLINTADIFENIWKDRPTLSTKPIFLHELSDSREEKIARIRSEMQKKNVDYYLLNTLDDIAWTFNIRCDDVDYNPVALAYAIISQQKAILFIDNQKVRKEIQGKLKEDGVQISDTQQVFVFLNLIANASILIDSNRTNKRLYDSVSNTCQIVDSMSISTALKAIKSPKEVEHFRNAMVKDGVALTKFFIWLEKNLGKHRITELKVSSKLREFRSQQADFVSESFGTIAGYNANGAMAHYHPTPESDTEILAEGSLLIDSGGQYLDGTTDITRTIALSSPNPILQQDFTLALKGVIALASAKFPAGTQGFQLDILARKALWEYGLNYGHGTGHGVGFFLCVHESPPSIAANALTQYPLQEGMVLSNEPAMYREGKYGIRTENLMTVKVAQENEFGKFLEFETITLCYIDTTLIDFSLLDEKEKEWLNNYHSIVYQKLSPHLNETEKNWLACKTKAI